MPIVPYRFRIEYVNQMRNLCPTVYRTLQRLSLFVQVLCLCFEVLCLRFEFVNIRSVTGLACFGCSKSRCLLSPLWQAISFAPKFYLMIWLSHGLLTTVSDLGVSMEYRVQVNPNLLPPQIGNSRLAGDTHSYFISREGQSTFSYPPDQ